MEYETRQSIYLRLLRQQSRAKVQDRKPRSRFLSWRKGRQPLHRHWGLHFSSHPVVRRPRLHGPRYRLEASQERLTGRTLMRHDLNEIAALLQIHEKAMGHPRLKPLADAAMKALQDMAEETAKPEPLVDTDPKGLDDVEPELEDDGGPVPTNPIRRL